MFIYWVHLPRLFTGSGPWSLIRHRLHYYYEQCSSCVTINIYRPKYLYIFVGSERHAADKRSAAGAEFIFTG